MLGLGRTVGWENDFYYYRNFDKVRFNPFNRYSTINLGQCPYKTVWFVFQIYTLVR